MNSIVIIYLPHLLLTNYSYDYNSNYNQILVIFSCHNQQFCIDLNCFPRWKLNNMIIDLNEQGSHYILTGSNLVINNPIKSKHEGMYSCLATNVYGTVISQEGSVQFGCKCPRSERSFSEDTLPWRTALELCFHAY